VRVQTPTIISLSSLVVQQRALEVAANNVANAETPGYKAERMMFSDWVSRQPDGSGIDFVQDRATYRDFQEGALTHTGNPLDLALGGPGWFTVMTANGPRLTRAGRFQPTTDGTLIDDAGDALLDANGQKLQIASSDTQLSVSADGSLSSENGPIGRIGVVMPQNEALLQGEGGELMSTTSPTSPVTAPHIVEGALEESNAQPIQETVKMMDVLRQFQFATQLVQAESDRLQSAIDKLTQIQS
jgi:flagellar basal-body rod protein FlgF